MVRQILLHWGNKLVEIDLFFYSYKNELLLVQQARIIAKSKKQISQWQWQEEAAKSYIKEQRGFRRRSKNRYKSLLEKEKEAKKEYSRNRYRNTK